MGNAAGFAQADGRIDYFSGTPRADAIDRWIYVAMAGGLLAITLAGFVPDSIEMVAAVKDGTHPPMTTVLHLHAVLMGSFLLLLLAQTWLAATGRIKGHMQLGLTALVLVPALVIVGTMLAAESYQQVAEVAASAEPDLRAAAEATVTRKENILLSQLRAGLLFPLFIALALLARHSDPGFHKRMMILGTASVMGAAIARVPGLPTSAPHSPISTELYILLLAVPMFARDLLRNGYVHRAYWVWLAIILPTQITMLVLWDTPWWHSVARAVLSA